MHVEKISSGRWTGAYRCTHGDAEIIVVTQVGPRILSLRWNRSANLLYEDRTGFAVGEWRLYGGHRFTVGPESAESYAPDNGECIVQGNDEEFRITTPTGRNGTRRSIILAGASDGEGFDLRHVLENHGIRPWSGTLWAITCVPATRAIAPIAANTVRLWPGTVKFGWEMRPGYVVARRPEIRGKIGGHSNLAFLASFQPEATFVIHDPDPPQAGECSDEGCNLEIFSCPEYLELETLGAAVIVPPGGHAVHRQRWRLLKPGYDARDWARIAAQAGCDSRKLVAHAC